MLLLLLNNAIFRLARLRSLVALLLTSAIYTLHHLNIQWDKWDIEDFNEDSLCLDLLTVPNGSVSSIEQPAPSRLPNSRHMYFPVGPASATELSIISSPTHADTPISCLESMLSTGEAICKHADTSIDAVWSWVNSSDQEWRSTHNAIDYRSHGQTAQTRIGYRAPVPHLQDFDELRYSMRSVLRHMQPYVHRFNLIASDFASPVDLQEEYNLTSEHRIGQLPQWLNASQTEWKDGDVQLSIHHHSTFFQKYTGTVFSSFAIESQLAYLQNISDIFMYFNDDMYLLKDFNPSDIYTSAYGFVLRVDPSLQVSPERDLFPVRGEWQALHESNVLLSERFGYGRRPYVNHMAKVMSIPIIREMAASFPEAFARTGARHFREVWRDEPGDIHTPFLFPHFVVERWREALLWSWTVARLGGDDDSWDADAAWKELGGVGDVMTFGDIRRGSLDKGRVAASLKRSGYSPPSTTTYKFASGDGYPFYGTRHGQKGYPDLTNASVCTLERHMCFPPGLSASTAFTHLAFERPECGDCVINRLVQQSGSLGLSAFLPAKDRTFVPRAHGPAPTTLPAAPSWHTPSFALADVLHQAPTDSVDVREWTLRVLERYRFVLGETPSEFVRLKLPFDASMSLKDLDKKSRVALACLNDDLLDDGSQIRQIVHSWQQRRWPEKAQWEV